MGLWLRARGPAFLSISIHPNHRGIAFLLTLILYVSSCAGLASDSIELLLPKHRILAEELAVIINDADPLSVRIGNYYRKARNIPPQNILRVNFKPGRARMGEKEFRRIKTRIDRLAPATVQAYAITWAAPYRVDCMSITTALAFGFDKDFCSNERCATTRRSPYFMNSTATPYTDLGIRPAIAIAAIRFEQAKALIDRGIQSDASHPAGVAYLVSTMDRARNVRSALYPKIAGLMNDWIQTKSMKTNALQDVNDILFYFTGTTRVEYLDSLGFVPGGIADHLTSTGGQLTNSKQMSALRWLEAGATGSYGTVIEPCNLPGKFPNPGLVMDVYGSGRTLLEAYWQSVQQPGEGIFVGEPLAAPFDGYEVDVQQDRILLTTRTLLPGLYQVLYSRNPVGPYRRLPGYLKSSYHQKEFVLPKPGAGYYKLQLAKGNRRP